MKRAQLWRRAQRVKAIHLSRERRACFGELVQSQRLLMARTIGRRKSLISLPA